MFQRKGAKVLIPILSFALLLCALVFYSQVISSHAAPAPAGGQGPVSKPSHQNHQDERFDNLAIAEATPTIIVPTATPTIIVPTMTPTIIIPTVTVTVPVLPTVTVPVLPTLTVTPTDTSTPVVTATDTSTPVVTATPTSVPTSVTFWVQSMDSCRQAIGGAFYHLTGNGLDQVAGPTPGNKPVTISSVGPCPIPRGNCEITVTGCLAFTLNVPTSGTASYTITEIKAPKGYRSCLRASKCLLPAVVNVTVDSLGNVSATTSILFGNGTLVVFPKSTSGSAMSPLVDTGALPADVCGGTATLGSCATPTSVFTGTITDPAIVYNSQICKSKDDKGKDDCKGKGMVMRAITKVAIAAINGNLVSARLAPKPAITRVAVPAIKSSSVSQRPAPNAAITRVATTATDSRAVSQRLAPRSAITRVAIPAIKNNPVVAKLAARPAHR